MWTWVFLFLINLIGAIGNISVYRSDHERISLVVGVLNTLAVVCLIAYAIVVNIPR